MGSVAVVEVVVVDDVVAAGCVVDVVEVGLPEDPPHAPKMRSQAHTSRNRRGVRHAWVALGRGQSVGRRLDAAGGIIGEDSLDLADRVIL